MSEIKNVESTEEKVVNTTEAIAVAVRKFP